MSTAFSPAITGAASHLEDNGFPYILSIYFGCPSLSLAVLGGLSNQQSPLPHRIRLFLLLSFAFCLSASLGRFLPGFSTLCSVIPVLRVFRFPVKILAGGILPVALLSGCALQAQTKPVHVRFNQLFGCYD